MSSDSAVVTDEKEDDGEKSKMVVEENTNSNQPKKKEGSEVPAIFDKAGSGDESSDKSFSSLSSENKQNQLKKRKEISSAKTSTSKKVKPNDNDLTTMEGQLAAHPGMSIDKAKSEAKREYNRRNAKKARARNKELVKELQNKVAELTKRTEELQRANQMLQAQVEVLTAQNGALQIAPPSEPTLKNGHNSTSSTNFMQQMFPGLVQPNAPLATQVLPQQQQQQQQNNNILAQLQSLLSATGGSHQTLPPPPLPNDPVAQLLKILQPTPTPPPPPPPPAPTAPQQDAMQALLQVLLASQSGALGQPQQNFGGNENQGK